jgi:hypothetical protein
VSEWVRIGAADGIGDGGARSSACRDKRITRAREPVVAAARFGASPKRERLAVRSATDAIATSRGATRTASAQVHPR